MSSSYKTPFLKLSNFVGSDKPKMDDVNYDNNCIDTALKSHIENENLHVTIKEKETWSKGAYIVGSYQGDAQPIREIVLGFAPGLCIVFHEGMPLAEYDTNSGNNVRAVIATKSGCTCDISITAKGFKIKSSTNASPFGSTGRMNLEGEKYVYIAYK